MGKKGKSNSTQASTTAKSCTCKDLYEDPCSCGNRPPRPSEGHKWNPETQAWGGKGHKQKGASGQTASFGQQATTTEVGKTSLAQWQRLPSQLLVDFCKGKKRPGPEFKSLPEKDGLFKYRVIVPDSKDPKKDLFFVPVQPVTNEEQAKEEAALLGLLNLTPTLPHERKLPEPYRTTWLNAVASSDQQTESKKQHPNKSNGAKQNRSNSVDHNDSNNAGPDKGSVAKRGLDAIGQTKAAAQASSSLKMATSYKSIAEKKKLHDEKRRLKNQRIQRHEAIRMANRDHVVAMSAPLRQQIERLLRGEPIQWDEMDSSDDDGDEDMAGGDLQYYVEDRLHREGFTRKQARLSILELGRTSSRVQKALRESDDESNWEMVFEECLQFLLVNVDEELLPLGIDPEKDNITLEKPENASPNPDSGLGAQLGLSSAEVKLVQNRKQEMRDEAPSFESSLWEILVRNAGVTLKKGASDTFDDHAQNTNRLALEEELEALEAIYGSDFDVKENRFGFKTICVSCWEGETELLVVVREGHYPGCHPEQLWLKGKWGSRLVGSAFHVELIKFISDISLDEPMIFEICGQVSTLFESLDELTPQLLLKNRDKQQLQLSSMNATTKNYVKKKNRNSVLSNNPSLNSNSIDSCRIRPRERKAFWSKPATVVPRAIAHPNVGASIESARKSLPAANAREDFLGLLRQAEQGSRVLLVTGDTGCGKTTQIPQFILEEKPGEVKIVVAQPRRLAATGVANRVAAERGEPKSGVGSVGYVVRGDSAICDKSRLVFCTTGVLLRQLQSDGALDCITHIVVDEVHERHLDTDILLGLVKQKLPHYPRLNVILMSATLDADRFAGYWSGNTGRMHIPGRTFPVKDFTLEDVIALTNYVPKGKGKKSKSSPWDDSQFHNNDDTDESAIDESVDPSWSTEKEVHGMPIEDIVKKIDETCIDYDLLAQLVMRLVKNKGDNDDGSILIFLPGAPEIYKALDVLKHCAGDLPIALLPLHGGLQNLEQQQVFSSAQKGFTKVILSTNIAETSITIPDCTIVIDSAREKQSSYDPANRMPLLVEQFASKASLKQRRGRAGRVQEGICYKLISKSTLSRLREHSEPEIGRCALDQSLLSLLYMGVESGTGSFLKTLLDPPSSEALDAAVTCLIQLGAAEKQSGRVILSPLGVHLAGIPAPPTIGKLLIMGSILGCQDAALAIAAGLSTGKSPFLRLDQSRSKDADSKKQATAARAELFESVGYSDHALLFAIVQRWKEAPSAGAKKIVCESLGLSFPVMKDISQLSKQLESSLASIGFESSNDANRNIRSWRIIRACTVSALAPGQLVKVVRPAHTYDQTAEGAKARDGKAKEMKFFIRSALEADGSGDSTKEERVFLHPSSCSFTKGSYNCPWLIYHSMVRTSKPFLRDVTECDSYPLLLFGGTLEIKASKGIVLIDNWVQLSANAGIGSLMGGLRRKVDDLLAKKVEKPSFEIANTEEMKLIVKLILRDGQS